MQHCFGEIKVSIRVNLDQLETTAAFSYLRRMVTFNSSILMTLYVNLSKAQRRWGIVVKLLVNMVVMVQEQAIMYKAVVRKVMICGGKSWVVMEVILKVME